MSLNLEELTKDLEELQRLFAGATRPKVKNALTLEIQKVQKEIASTKKQPETIAATPSSVSASSNLLPTTKITTYAWDQSEKFLKLYITMPGAEPGQESRVRLTVQQRSIDLVADDIAGKNYYFAVKGLLSPIESDGSTFKLKKGEIVLMLKKKDSGKTWPCVTETEMQNKEKSKPKFDDNEDPNTSLMKMMKQMYDDGDDDMKRTIKKAWTEAQDKKMNGGAGDAMSDFM